MPPVAFLWGSQAFDYGILSCHTERKKRVVRQLSTLQKSISRAGAAIAQIPRGGMEREKPEEWTLKALLECLKAAPGGDFRL
jgi:hypothetical protein